MCFGACITARAVYGHFDAALDARSTLHAARHEARQNGGHMSWYMTVLRKYAEFDGRARRREYWGFVLVNLLVLILLAVPDALLGLATPGTGVGLSAIYVLAVAVPWLAVTVRRLHDVGRSGWWVLVGFIPYAGAIVLLVFALLDSQPGNNEYGPNPKAAPVLA